MGVGRHLGGASLAMLLAACSGPSYYLQAVSGHLELMRARQDIQAIIDDPGTEPGLASRLETAERIRTFAADILDLPADDSYTSFVALQREAVTWNVVATPEFSLTPKKWCFIVAGCLPYRGFFHAGQAQASATRWRSKGFDVFVAPASAYSSLGWFEDPLLSTMLSGSDTRLAAHLFHELAHQRLYLKSDGGFSEAYASFVERAGVDAWLESASRGDDLSRWHLSEAATTAFSGLVRDSRAALGRLYGSAEPEVRMREQKAALLGRFRNAVRQLARDHHKAGVSFDSWLDGPVNNARLALYSTYEGGHCAFRHLFEEAGGQWRTFHRLARAASRLDKREREAWLNRPCDDPPAGGS